MQKGKKLTRDQKQVVMRNKRDPSNYLYIKTETVNEDPEKRGNRLNRVDSKLQYLILRNVTTDGIERFEV